VIALPAGVETDKSSAGFRKGVLRIVIPRSKEARTETKKIPIQSR
jgi:HSP20 family molecular chaperone IbpA